MLRLNPRSPASRRFAAGLVFASLLAALLLSGCGGKDMSDDDFVDVANTIYKNIRGNWDHQPGETWESYLERRVGEACGQSHFKVKDWDKKLRDVAAHPDRFADKIDDEVLAEILKWQQDRLRAKGQS